MVLPMREVINAVLRHRKDINAPTELDPWYDDLYDHVLRASEWTESLRDMVTTIFETNLSLQDARLNTVMKKLTGWAAIIAVPTAVTGYFGQNVPYPGFGKDMGLRHQRRRHHRHRRRPIHHLQTQGMDLTAHRSHRRLPAQRWPGSRCRQDRAAGSGNCA